MSNFIEAQMDDYQLLMDFMTRIFCVIPVSQFFCTGKAVIAVARYYDVVI